MSIIAEERQQQLKDATKATASAEQHMLELSRALKLASADAEALQHHVEDLHQARLEEAELCNKIFQDPAWMRDPSLGPLLASIQQLDSRANEAQGYATTYGRAGGLLSSANRKIAEAMQGLRRTRFMGMMEMGMDLGSPLRRPGGSMFMVCRCFS